MHRLLSLLLLLLIALPARAEPGVGETRLQHFLDGLDGLQAHFIQHLIDHERKVIEESEGLLEVSRPGRFRLEYTSPYHQLYIADGKKVWMYEEELAQATVRDQDATLANTPAELLSNPRPLREQFRIEEKGEHEGLVWIELRPLGSEGEGGFDYIRLAMEGATLRAMEMVDGLGQTTRLYFKEMQRNPPLIPQRFQFTPPDGVDVIGRD